MRRLWLLFLSVFATFALETASGVPADATTADIVGAARVYEDGLLRIGAQTIRLFGIYIPPTERTCEVILQPARCGSRAAIALEFKIQGFVHCSPIAANADGSISAVCYVGRTFRTYGEDLGAFLLIRGWAVALPDAPFEYVALERIARTRRLGIWGFPADVIIFD